MLTYEEHLVGIQKRVLQVTAEEYYKRGNEYRRKGDWKHALDNYLEAIALDPESPAVEAKRMIDDILAYYCKDMYNP